MDVISFSWSFNRGISFAFASVAFVRAFLASLFATRASSARVSSAGGPFPPITSYPIFSIAPAFSSYVVFWFVCFSEVRWL